MLGVISRPSNGSIEGLLQKFDLFQKDLLERLKDVLRAFTRNKPGLVPAPGGSTTTRFLCEDGTWKVP